MRLVHNEDCAHHPANLNFPCTCGPMPVLAARDGLDVPGSVDPVRKEPGDPDTSLWWRCRCHDALLSECPNRELIRAALSDDVDVTIHAGQVWYTPDCGHVHIAEDGKIHATCPDRVEWPPEGLV